MSDWFEHYGFASVGDRLLAGAHPLDASDVSYLEGLGVEVVYNLCEDREYSRGQREAVAAALAQASIRERRLALIDYGGLAPEALDQSVADVVEELSAHRTVYLHCRAGWQRSAAVAAAVIAVREDLSLPQALAALSERKPSAEPLSHQRADLLAWWKTRHGAGREEGPRRDDRSRAAKRLSARWAALDD